MSKLKYSILAVFFILPLSLYAAGPITHVALGEKWLSYRAKDYTEEQKKLFLLGTVFPDIRYLGVIKRDKTHYKGITLDNIARTESPFQQGVLFHSFVDEFRQKWVRKHKIYEKLKNISDDQKDTFLKMIEDQILYSKSSWTTFCYCLMTIPEEEKKYGIDEKFLNEWHTGLTLYFTASPMVLLIQIGAFEKDVFNIKAAVIKEWGRLLPQYVEHIDMQNYVNALFLAFEEKIKV